jgi:hypothetical protein
MFFRQTFQTQSFVPFFNSTILTFKKKGNISNGFGHCSERFGAKNG